MAGAYIAKPDELSAQPQGLPGIAKANRLGSRVRSLVLRGVNLANGRVATWNGTRKFAGGAPDGVVTSLDGSSYLDLTNVGLYAPATAPVTLAFFSRNATPASVGGTLRITPSSGGNTFCAIRGTNSSYRLGAGYATGGTLPMFTGAAVAASGVAERTVITCANGLTSTTSTDFEVWINGAKYTTSGPIAFGAQTAGATYFGWDGADSKYPGSIDELIVFEGKLSDSEVAEYFRNPYQMYARPAARVWVVAATSGAGNGAGVTLTTTASLLAGPATASATAAGITLTDAASLLAGAATGQINATASGSTVTATASVLPGTAAGQANATAAGATLTATASEVPGAATGQSNATAAGATITGTASLIAGAAAGQSNATGAGTTLAAAAALLPGSASAANAGSAAGATITASASLIAGAAAGQVNATAGGQVLTATASLNAGAAAGQTNAAAAGATITATASVTAGAASGTISATAGGVIIEASAAFLAGSAAATAGTNATAGGAVIVAIASFARGYATADPLIATDGFIARRDAPAFDARRGAPSYDATIAQRLAA